MFRGLAVVLFMCLHFVKNAAGRKKYRVDDKELDIETKRIYTGQIYKIMQSFSRGTIRASGSTVTIKGKENLPTTSGNLYVANHRGLFDSLVIADTVDDPCIFIGKNGIKKMPIVRTWFSAIGSIYITREDSRQSLEVIKKGIQTLKDKQSVVIFPEGTRTKTGELGEFKAGSFKLAFNSNALIVPIAIKNTELIFEKNNKRVKPANVYVNVGKPIDVSVLSKEQKKAIPRQVQDYIQELLDELN
ncbi:MAG: hypothetical protein BEN19_02940 [Epulopiscium sp. Nuni2H_MBin003]|nr:MAG: hypothetical protein BEN19_02940 [Epulopiscium sp. Nuni2H_MBin003]